jgi:hypothetical protein
METDEVITSLVRLEYYIDDGEYYFADTIVFEINDFLKLTPTQIQKLKMDKFNEWKSLMAKEL